MPLDDPDKFDLWLRERWYEKDALMEQYISTGRFPANKAVTNGTTKSSGKDEDFIETEVKLGNWWEVGNIFVVLATFALIFNLLARVWTVAIYGKKA